MKNVLITLFLLVVCVAGTVIGAGIYFGLIFGTLASLVGANTSTIGEHVGALAAGLGLPLGVVIFFILGWHRLVRANGRPDPIARGLAVILGGVVALAWLATVEPALAAVEIFKVPGFLAVAGFVSMVGWFERRFRLA